MNTLHALLIVTLKIICVGFLLGSAPLLAQDSSSPGEASPIETRQSDSERIDMLTEILQTQVLRSSTEQLSAPVVVNGKELFRLRGISSVPAKKRAKVIGGRIEALAENPEFDADTLRVEASEFGYNIYAGESSVVLLNILEEDAQLEMINHELLANLTLAKVKEAVREYRHDRKPEVLWSNAVTALLRTLGLVLTLVLANWFFKKSDIWLEKQLKRRISDLELKSLSLVKAEQVWKVFRIVLRIVRGLIYVVIAYLFLTSVLNLFPWTRYYATTALSYVLVPLTSMAAGLIAYIPNLIFLVFLYYIVRYLLKLIHRYFRALHEKRLSLSGFDPEWSLPTYRIVRVLVLIMALVVAYPYIPGSNSEAFKGISILVGLLLSLGSTSVISNIIAGYTMTYRRAFRVGERVKIGEVVGDVEEMRLLVTHVRSLKNEEVIIPNSTILSNDVINYSRMASSHGLILHTTVGIGYEVPWRQVEAMLIEAAERTDGLDKDTHPFVLQKSLSDFAVEYELNVYCRDEKKAAALYSDLHRNIQDVFNENEVSIMTPAYVADTDEPKVVPEEQWFTPPAEPKGQ